MPDAHPSAAAPAAAGTASPAAPASAGVPPAASTSASPAAAGTSQAAAPGTPTTAETAAPAAPAADPLAPPPAETTKAVADPLAPAEIKPQTDAEKKAAADKAAADAKAKADAPFVFKVPEGTTPEAKANAETWAPAFKEAGVTPEQAEKLVAIALKNAADPKVLEAVKAAEQKKDADALQKQRETDRASWLADPKIGGANYEVTVKTSRNVLAQIPGGSDLAKELSAKGLSFSPALHRFLAGIRSLIAEDSTSSRMPNSVPPAQKVVLNDPLHRSIEEGKRVLADQKAARTKR